MSVSLILLVLLGGALLVPMLGGDGDDGDDSNDIEGGPGDDEISGTEGNDLIRTFLGDDTIEGNGGNDEIRSGGDDDEVWGGDGLDFIRAGEGQDRVFGGNDNDRIFGDQGDDYLDGGRGEDVIRGGAGDDLVFGGSENLAGQADDLSGEDDDDTIFAWGGGSTLNGGTNDADNPGSNDDTLVMVTGEGEMTNGTGDNMNIALAKVTDGQDTFITVTDFDLEDDTLVLTVDYATFDGEDVVIPPMFTVTYSFVDATETTGAGMLVEVAWDNEGENGDVAESESASAFLLGYSPANAAGFGLDPNGGTIDPDDPDAPISIDVHLTHEASLDDPLATMNQIGISTPAMAAWPAP